MTTYVDRGREYDVILQARRDPRETSTDLTNIRVRSTRTSELIPLASIVRLEETSGTMQLSRFNRLRAIKVQADLADGYTMGQAVEWFTDTVARGFPEATLMWDVESAECTRTGQQLYFSRISRACGPVRELRASADHHGDRAARAARCVFGLKLSGLTVNIFSQIAAIMLIGIAAPDERWRGRDRSSGPSHHGARARRSLSVRPVRCAGAANRGIIATPLVGASWGGGCPWGGTAMPYSKYLPLVWAGIWRKRGRSVLMLLQIASAFALFGLLEGVNSGIKQALAATHRDRLYIGSSVSLGDPLPISMLGRIRATPGVEVVAPRQGLPGTYQQPDQGVPVIATEPGAFFAIYDELEASQDTIEALESNRTGVIVGSVTMERFGWKAGDRIVLQSPVPTVDGSRDWAFDVVGAYDDPETPTNATALIANFQYVDESRQIGRDNVQLYVAKIDDAANAASIGLAIDNAFANSDRETRTQSEADLAASQVQQIGDLNFIARAIIGAVFFALLFATGALMMQSIRERMPELAVLKTFGFSDRLVMGLIVVEAVTFCVFSAAIGLGIAYVVLPLASRFIGIAGMPSVVVIAGLGLAVLLALIGSSVPAWRGLRLQVAEALAGR